MDLTEAQSLVMERLRNQGYDPVEADGTKHVNARWGSGTWRTFMVRWTDDGEVQFPEVLGSGTGKENQPGKLFKSEADPRAHVAIVDTTTSRIYVMQQAVVREHVARLDGMTWVTNIEELSDYLDAWPV